MGWRDVEECGKFSPIKRASSCTRRRWSTLPLIRSRATSAIRARTRPNRSRRSPQSIREFGFTNPVHGRLLAALQLEMALVPCLRLRGLTEAQQRAYVVADNKLA